MPVPRIHEMERGLARQRPGVRQSPGALGFGHAHAPDRKRQRSGARQNPWAVRAALIRRSAR